MEEIAFRKQIDILEKYKKVAPPKVSIIALKVEEWKNDGSFRINIKKYLQETENLINGLVQQYEMAIELVKEDTDASKYTEESDKNDCRVNEAISKALNLPIDVNLGKTRYKTASFCF